MGPLQSDSGLNSCIYSESPNPTPPFLAQHQKPNAKKATDLSCFGTDCVVQRLFHVGYCVILVWGPRIKLASKD